MAAISADLLVSVLGQSRAWAWELRIVSRARLGSWDKTVTLLAHGDI